MSLGTYFGWAADLVDAGALGMGPTGEWLTPADLAGRARGDVLALLARAEITGSGVTLGQEEEQILHAAETLLEDVRQRSS